MTLSVVALVSSYLTPPARAFDPTTSLVGPPRADDPTHPERTERDDYETLAAVFRELRAPLDMGDQSATRRQVLELESELRDGWFDQVPNQAAALRLHIQLLRAATAELPSLPDPNDLEPMQGDQQRKALNRNRLPVEPLLELALIHGQDIDRLEALEGNDTPQAVLERDVILESAATTSALLDFLVLLPVVPHLPLHSGLTQAGPTLEATDRLLRKGRQYRPRVHHAVSYFHRGADALSALRLGSARATLDEISLRHAAQPVLALAALGRRSPSELDEAETLELDRRQAGLRWVSVSKGVAARWRGVAALMGDELIALGQLLGAEVPPWHEPYVARAAFLAAALGEPQSCVVGEADHLLPGGDRDTASEAARRLFNWLRPDLSQPGSPPLQPVLSGLVEHLEAGDVDRLMCQVALRDDIPESIPAALALAHRRFDPPYNDKQAAWWLALQAIHSAQRVRHEVDPGEWWTAEFGELLVPFLIPPAGAASPTDPKALVTWAADEGTTWLHGHSPDPAWLALNVASSPPAAPLAHIAVGGFGLVRSAVQPSVGLVVSGGIDGRRLGVGARMAMQVLRFDDVLAWTGTNYLLAEPRWWLVGEYDHRLALVGLAGVGFAPEEGSPEFGATGGLALRGVAGGDGGGVQLQLAGLVVGKEGQPTVNALLSLEYRRAWRNQ